MPMQRGNSGNGVSIIQLIAMLSKVLCSDFWLPSLKTQLITVHFGTQKRSTI